MVGVVSVCKDEQSGSYHFCVEDDEILTEAAFQTGIVNFSFLADQVEGGYWNIQVLTSLIIIVFKCSVSRRPTGLANSHGNPYKFRVIFNILGTI